MSSGPKGSAESSGVQCTVCGCRAELVELPGREEKHCLQCSADLATSILLVAEIDAATLSEQETAGLVAEFAQLSERMLHRAQSA